MSIDCNTDGEIEYLDEVLDFTNDVNEDDAQEFMDFSEHMLSMSNVQYSHGIANPAIPVASSSPRTAVKATSSRPFSSTVNPGNREYKKKRKHFVPTKTTTVGKNDVRRTYAQNYIDGLNSGNIPIFSKCILDMAAPNIVLICRNYSMSGMFLPSVVETLGHESIVAFYEVFIKSMPDSVFELISSTIRVFSDGTSTIIGRCTVHGTKVFPLAGLEENGDQKVVLSTVDELTSKFGKVQLNAKVTTTVNDPVTGDLREVDTDVKVAVGKAHKTQAKLSILASVNLHLNPEKKVFRIDFFMTNLNEPASPPPPPPPAPAAETTAQTGTTTDGERTSSIDSGSTL